MGQSLVKNYVHIVFSTKHREPTITSTHEEELHLYITGICKNLDSHAVIVGGYNDHIHILCSLSRKLALMTLVQKIKTNSSKWMNLKPEIISKFRWQDGYGGFSVNPNEIDVVERYIQNQHKHHGKKGFKEEYLSFLKKYNLEYDEKYMWD